MAKREDHLPFLLLLLTLVLDVLGYLDLIIKL